MKRGFDWERPHDGYYACENCEYVYDIKSICTEYDGEYDDVTSLPVTCPQCKTYTPNFRPVKEILEQERISCDEHQTDYETVDYGSSYNYI